MWQESGSVKSTISTNRRRNTTTALLARPRTRKKPSFQHSSRNIKRAARSYPRAGAFFLQWHEQQCDNDGRSAPEATEENALAAVTMLTGCALYNGASSVMDSSSSYRDFEYDRSCGDIVHGRLEIPQNRFLLAADAQDPNANSDPANADDDGTNWDTDSGVIHVV